MRFCKWQNRTVRFGSVKPHPTEPHRTVRKNRTVKTHVFFICCFFSSTLLQNDWSLSYSRITTKTLLLRPSDRPSDAEGRLTRHRTMSARRTRRTTTATAATTATAGGQNGTGARTPAAPSARYLRNRGGSWTELGWGWLSRLCIWLNEHGLVFPLA